MTRATAPKRLTHALAVLVLPAAFLAAPVASRRAIAAEPPIDVSTPDKALESFVAFWDACLHDTEHRRSVREEAGALSDSYRTDELRAKKAAEQARTDAANQLVTIVPGKLHIENRVEGQTSCLFTVWRDMTIRQKDLLGGDQVTESQSREPYSFDLAKVGDRWLIRELKKVCYSCVGTASCSSCKGYGTVEYRTCSQCNGNKICQTCNGKVLLPASITFDLLLGYLPTFFVAGEGGFEPSRDRSSPRAAAKAYMDSWKQRELVTTRLILEWVDRKMATLAELVTPDVAAAARENLKIWVDLGKDRFAKVGHEIESVEERGGLAFARTVASVDDVTYRAGLLLAPSGRGWAVAGELVNPCVFCAGAGVCPLCKGAGQAEGMQCFACAGKGGCDPCKGFGVVE